MRLAWTSLVAMLAGCAPSIAEGDPDQREPSYEYVRCDGSYVPELPDLSESPYLGPAGTAVEGLQWDPPLPPSAFDPTTDAFDPTVVTPDGWEAFIADVPYPTLPDDPLSSSAFEGGYVRESRYMNGGQPWSEWAPVALFTLDGAGRLETELLLDLKDEPIVTINTWVGDYRTAVVAHFENGMQVRENGLRSVTSELGFYQSGRIRDGATEQLAETFEQRLDLDPAAPDLHRGLWHVHEGGLTGEMVRWAPGHEDPWRFDAEQTLRVGALARFSRGRLSEESTPIGIMDGGHTVVTWWPNGVSATVFCPNEDEAIPADWVEFRNGQGARWRRYSGPHSWGYGAGGLDEESSSSGIEVVSADGLEQTRTTWERYLGDRIDTRVSHLVFTPYGLVLSNISEDDDGSRRETRTRRLE